MSKELLKKISKKATMAIIFVAVSFVLCFYFVGRINRISADLTDKKEMLFLSQNSQEQFTLLREDYQKISPYLGKVNNVFPSSENLLPFINEMESLAVLSGVQQSFKFESTGLQPIPDLSLNKIAFNIMLSGDMSKFLVYLNNLEKAPYFLQVSSLIIAATQGIESQGQMSVRGNLYVK